jgi:hypothetical protein
MATVFEKIEEQLIRDAAEFDVDMKHLEDDWAVASETARTGIEATSPS